MLNDLKQLSVIWVPPINTIVIHSFILCELYILRLSRLTNPTPRRSSFSLQVYRQAGRPQRVDCLAPMGNMPKVFFQKYSGRGA